MSLIDRCNGATDDRLNGAYRSGGYSMRRMATMLGCTIRGSAGLLVSLKWHETRSDPNVCVITENSACLNLDPTVSAAIRIFLLIQRMQLSVPLNAHSVLIVLRAFSITFALTVVVIWLSAQLGLQLYWRSTLHRLRESLRNLAVVPQMNNSGTKNAPVVGVSAKKLKRRSVAGCCLCRR